MSYPIYTACLLNKEEIAFGEGTAIRIFNFLNWQNKVIEGINNNIKIKHLCVLDESTFAFADSMG